MDLTQEVENGTDPRGKAMLVSHDAENCVAELSGHD